MKMFSFFRHPPLEARSRGTRPSRLEDEPSPGRKGRLWPSFGLGPSHSMRSGTTRRGLTTWSRSCCSPDLCEKLPTMWRRTSDSRQMLWLLCTRLQKCIWWACLRTQTLCASTAKGSLLPPETYNLHIASGAKKCDAAEFPQFVEFVMWLKIKTHFLEPIVCIFEDTGGNYDVPLKLSEGRNSSISMSHKGHKILCMCRIKAFKEGCKCRKYREQ